MSAHRVPGVTASLNHSVLFETVFKLHDYTAIAFLSKEKKNKNPLSPFPYLIFWYTLLIFSLMPDPLANAAAGSGALLQSCWPKCERARCGSLLLWWYSNAGHCCAFWSIISPALLADFTPEVVFHTALTSCLESLGGSENCQGRRGLSGAFWLCSGGAGIITARGLTGWCSGWRQQREADLLGGVSAVSDLPVEGRWCYRGQLLSQK